MTKSKHKNLKELKAQLMSVHKELERSLEIADDTSICCKINIENLLDKLNLQIENVNKHLKFGLDKENVINK